MKLDWFGVNVGHDPVFEPDLIATAGFNAIRIVGQRHVYLPPYIDRCHRRGVKVGMVLTYGESMVVKEQGGRRMSAEEAAEYYAKTYVAREDGRNVDVWMIGNESNGHHGENLESSVMSPEEWNGWFPHFIYWLRKLGGADLPIYAVGTVTGDPERVKDYGWAGFTGLDNHAYAQWPESVGGMLRNYNWIDEEWNFNSRIVSEYGWPHPDPVERARYIVKMTRALEKLVEEDSHAVHVRGAWVYCWELRQHWQPFGLGTKDGVPLPTWDIINELGYAPSPPPPAVGDIDWDNIGPGFRRWMELEPQIVGSPSERQEHGAPGAISSILTTRGHLFWIGQRARKPEYGTDVDPVLFFKDNEGKTRRFKEHWERSEELW